MMHLHLHDDVARGLYGGTEGGVLSQQAVEAQHVFARAMRLKLVVGRRLHLRAPLLSATAMRRGDGRRRVPRVIE